MSEVGICAMCHTAHGPICCWYISTNGHSFLLNVVYYSCRGGMLEAWANQKIKIQTQSEYRSRDSHTKLYLYLDCKMTCKHPPHLLWSAPSPSKCPQSICVTIRVLVLLSLAIFCNVKSQMPLSAKFCNSDSSTYLFITQMPQSP